MAVPLSRGHIMKGQPCNISSHVSCSENSSDHLNSHLDLKHPKTYCGFMFQPQALLHPMGGPIAGFLSRPRPRFWKKNAPKFLGDHTSGSGPRSWLPIQPDTPGTRLWAWNRVWAWAALEQFKMVCWKFGFHIFFSSLWTPLSTLGIA